MTEKSRYLNILESYDDPLRWEAPKDFDYNKEQTDFVAAKDRLQHVLRDKLQYETDSAIQDASYHSAILLNKANLKSDSDFSQVRFSNFGKMITFSNEDCVLEKTQIEINQHLSYMGYRYIPEDILFETYTGKKQRSNGHRNLVG